MLRAVVRAALLAAVALSTTPALAQAPPAAWTSLIPPGQYRTLAWRDGPEFLYLLQPAGRAPGSVRIFIADVATLGVHERDGILTELSTGYARAIAAHDVLVEPITTSEGVVAYVIRHREIAWSTARDGRGNVTLYVRSPAHAETGGGGGGAGGGGGM